MWRTKSTAPPPTSHCAIAIFLNKVLYCGIIVSFAVVNGVTDSWTKIYITTIVAFGLVFLPITGVYVLYAFWYGVLEKINWRLKIHHSSTNFSSSPSSSSSMSSDSHLIQGHRRPSPWTRSLWNFLSNLFSQGERIKKKFDFEIWLKSFQIVLENDNEMSKLMMSCIRPCL